MAASNNQLSEFVCGGEASLPADHRRNGGRRLPRQMLASAIDKTLLAIESADRRCA